MTPEANALLAARAEGNLLYTWKALHHGIDVQ